MSESALLPIFSYLGWSFLPNLATQFVQSIYYRLTISAGTPHPQPGTAVHARDYRRIRILVLCLYLFYTLIQSLYDIRLAGDFYTLLSVSPYISTDKEIRTRLRRLAARYHPDKQPTSSPSSEQTYLQLRLAGETLTTPSHKYAYTHFGPSILSHLPRPSSDSDPSASSSSQNPRLETATLITAALTQKIPQYLSTLVFIYLLNTFLLPTRAGKYWRYLIIAASFALELYLLTHDIPPLPSWVETPLHLLRTHTRLSALLPPHLLPFQLLNLSSSLALSLNIFISQISALFPGASGAADLSDAVQLRGWMQGLVNSLGAVQGVSGRVDAEAGSLVQLGFAPFKGRPREVAELRRGMKEGVVLGSVRGHPEVKEAVKRVLARGKSEREGDRDDGADVVDLLNSDEQFM